MSTTLKSEISISAPIEKVWQSSMNPEYVTQWLTNCEGIEHLSGRPGTVGSKSKLTFWERGKKVEMQEEIVKVKVNKEFALKIVDPWVLSYNKLSFRYEDGVTVVNQQAKCHPKTIFMKMLMPFIKRSLQKRINNDLANLKKLLESQNKQ